MWAFRCFGDIHPRAKEKQQACLSFSNSRSCILVWLGALSVFPQTSLKVCSCSWPQAKKNTIAMHLYPSLYWLPPLFSNINVILQPRQQSFPALFPLPSSTTLPLLLLLPLLPTPQHLQMSRFLGQFPLRLPNQTSGVFLPLTCTY